MNADNLRDNFLEIYENWDGVCNDDYFSFTNNKDNLKQFLDYEPINDDLEIFQKIVQTNCNKLSYFNSLNEITDAIFSNQSKNNPILFSIHSANFYAAYISQSSQEIFDNLKEEILILKKYQSLLQDTDYFENILVNFYDAIDAFDLSQYSDVEEGKLDNHFYTVNIFLKSIEEIILSSVNSNFDDDKLKNIASLLLQIRIDKLGHMHFYDNALNKLAEKNQFHKIYIQNYDFNRNKIIYKEFSNILKQSSFTELTLDLDQVADLQIVSLEPGLYNFETSDISKKFIDFLINYYLKNVSNNPDKVIFRLQSLQSSAMVQGNKKICEIKNYNHLNEDNDLKKYLLTSSRLNSINYICSDGEDYLNSFYFELSKLLNFYDDNSIDFGFVDTDEQEFISDILINSHQFFLYLFNENKILSFDSSLNAINFSKNLIKKYKPKNNISSSDDLAYYNVLYQQVDFFKEINNNFSGVEYEVFKQEIEELLEVHKGFSLDYHKIVDDFLDPELDLTFSDQLNSVTNIMNLLTADFTTHNLNTIDYSYEYIANELNKQDSNSSDVKHFVDLLNLTSKILDKSLTSIKPPTEQFIFMKNNIDMWVLFKNLSSLELQLGFILQKTKHYEFNDYLDITKKRSNQILQLRPNAIAQEKYKSFLIPSLKDKNMQQILKEYDSIQRKYNNLIESRILMSSNIYEASQDVRLSLEGEYKLDLMNLQGQIFSEKYKDVIGELFIFDVLDTSAIKNEIKENEAIISFISGVTYSYILYITKERHYLFPIRELSSLIFDHKNDLLGSLKDPKNMPNIKSASNLYEIILRFIEVLNEDLSIKINELIIVPDFEFYDLPIHALYNSQTNKWAAEEYNFKYLSSEKLALYIDKSYLNANQNFLGFANPVLGNSFSKELQDFFAKRGEVQIQEIDDLYELPETEMEIKNISKYFKNNKLFFQENAVKINLRNNISDADVIAFATHAIRGRLNDYEDRGLVLSSENKSSKSAFLSSAEIENLKFNRKPLVLLNACNIIESPYYGSQPFSGLAGSFMNAGADSLLISLWNIDSLSAKSFTESIFNTDDEIYMSQSVNKSMLDMIYSENYSHPYYWAPYIYLGR